MTTSERRAPHRHDAWFVAGVPGWKRRFARLVAAGNRALDRLPLCRAAYRWQLRRGLEVSTVALPLRPGSGSLEGLRFAFLSDVHVGSYLHVAELEWVLDQVAALRIDALLLGGDLTHTRRSELDAWAVALRRIEPRLGCYAVPGNHERYGGGELRAWEVRMHDLGVNVLCNRGVRIGAPGDSLWLCGVDDLAEGAPRVERALAGRRDDETALCLSHHPDLFPELAGRGVDLTLSGHTHGGQVAPFGRVLLPHSSRGLHRGAYRQGDERLYVGRGVGAAILPLRVGARPEIVVVELTRSA